MYKLHEYIGIYRNISHIYVCEYHRRCDMYHGQIIGRNKSIVISMN